METRSNHVLVGAVVLILLAMVAIFTVWIARLSGGSEREYDIFFRQAVDGLAKGSAVTFSGVPSGQVKSISLWRPDPQFVRVRIAVNEETPILRGTTATIQGSFTGTSTVSLDGAIKGAPPISCPEHGASSQCPLGVPVIPTKTGGLGAILNSAPQLLERLSTLTERLTGLLSDRNQASIAGILDNTNRLTDAIADRGPEIAATLAQTRIAIQQAGDAEPQRRDRVDQAVDRYAQRRGQRRAAGAHHFLEADDPAGESTGSRSAPDLGLVVGNRRAGRAGRRRLADRSAEAAGL